MKVGEVITEKTVRSIRPGYGLAPKYYEQILGQKVEMDVKKGTPVDWSLIG